MTVLRIAIIIQRAIVITTGRTEGRTKVCLNPRIQPFLPLNVETTPHPSTAVQN